MGSVEGQPRWSFRPSSPRTPAGPSAVAKPLDDLQLWPTLTRVQSLKSSSLGGGEENGSATPCRQGGDVTLPPACSGGGCPSRDPRPSESRARAPSPLTRLPPLPPPLPNFRPPCSLTAVNRASSALPLPRRPHLQRRSGLPCSGLCSWSAGYPLSNPVPKSRRSGCVGLGGAVAAATTVLHSFLPPWTRRTLQVCVQRGSRHARPPGRPLLSLCGPLCRAALPGSPAELRLP